MFPEGHGEVDRTQRGTHRAGRPEAGDPEAGRAAPLNRRRPGTAPCATGRRRPRGSSSAHTEPRPIRHRRNRASSRSRPDRPACRFSRPLPRRRGWATGHRRPSRPRRRDAGANRDCRSPTGRLGDGDPGGAEFGLATGLYAPAIDGDEHGKRRDRIGDGTGRSSSPKCPALCSKNAPLPTRRRNDKRPGRFRPSL
jgi:hypothetical protein